jgi:hypothetical protein
MEAHKNKNKNSYSNMVTMVTKVAITQQKRGKKTQ